MANTSDRERTSVMLPKQDLDQLKALAEEADRSLMAEIRLAVTAYLKEKGRRT